VEREIEIAGLASLGGWLKRRPKHPTAPPGSPCANCGTTLEGPYCHQCGQLAEDFHRSISHLIEETFENLLHLDGRLWTTLPRLALKPASLTREYLEGHRASQIPPMRLFLVVVLLFFFAGSLGANEAKLNFTYGGKPVTAADHAQQKGGMGLSIDRDEKQPRGALSKWAKPRVAYAATHRREYLQTMETWAHRLAFLLLPASALMLGLLFAFKRRFFLYDHLIFSMHSLSFMGLLLSVTDLLKALGTPSALAESLALAMPVHLFVHLRGVYGLGVMGTLVRMALLFAMTVMVLFLGLVLLLFVALGVMPASAAA
jgi:hypothetical protein